MIQWPMRATRSPGCGTNPSSRLPRFAADISYQGWPVSGPAGRSARCGTSPSSSSTCWVSGAMTGPRAVAIVGVPSSVARTVRLTMPANDRGGCIPAPRRTAVDARSARFVNRIHDAGYRPENSDRRIVGLGQPTAGRREPMSDTQGNFVWYELQTRDVNGASKFYKDVIGWGTEAFEGDMPYSTWTVGGSSIGGVTTLPDDA